MLHFLARNRRATNRYYTPLQLGLDSNNQFSEGRINLVTPTPVEMRQVARALIEWGLIMNNDAQKLDGSSAHSIAARALIFNNGHTSLAVDTELTDLHSDYEWLRRAITRLHQNLKALRDAP